MIKHMWGVLEARYSAAEHESKNRSKVLRHTIDNRGEGWTGNARTVRVPVCIDHPILYIWDFWKVYFLRGNLEHFSP